MLRHVEEKSYQSDTCEVNENFSASLLPILTKNLFSPSAMDFPLKYEFSSTSRLEMEVDYLEGRNCLKTFESLEESHL